ncbi:MAG: 3-deoxy-manno-octulosonate-8-phosphatase KdsC [Thiotrichales bacterium]|nr:3-deoxy-manno-octulosonate-8-phosphatase KdsC [Thiotrichales bacterium]
MQVTAELREKAGRIKLVVFDVDGVLTDGSLYLGEDGNEFKAFNVKDGLGMVMLRQSGCQLAVITARRTSIVADRMATLGINHVYQGQDDKRMALLDLAKQLNLQPEAILYVGDDLIDLPAMRIAGLPVAVADAHAEVKQHALAITDANGGHGAAREVCEFVLSAQGRWQAILEDYLRTD